MEQTNGQKINPLTSYQGKKRCFGEYKCHVCLKTWKSANSRANESQLCTRCYAQVFPIKQKSFQSLYENLRKQKSDKYELIQAQMAKQNEVKKTPETNNFMHGYEFSLNQYQFQFANHQSQFSSYRYGFPGQQQQLQ